jgi:hypothetical protein
MWTGPLGDFPHHDEYQVRIEESGNGLHYWAVHDRDTDLPVFGSRCGYATEDIAAEAARAAFHIHPVNIITSHGTEGLIP